MMQKCCDKKWRESVEEDSEEEISDDSDKDKNYEASKESIAHCADEYEPKNKKMKKNPKAGTKKKASKWYVKSMCI